MIWDFFFVKNRIRCKLESYLNDKNARVLDLGCGENPYYHKKISGKVVCLDIKRTASAHIVSDADKLALKSNSFDKITSVNSFYYFENPFNVAKQLNRILKKTGKLILVVPFFYPIHDAPIDKYRFTEYGLRSVLGEYFRIEKIDTIGGIFSLPAVLLHSLIKGIPLMFPKSMRPWVQTLAFVLYPFYLLAQLLSIFNFLDRTRRFPTYYFVVATRK
jgi:SAM-dependent methyltransferase